MNTSVGMGSKEEGTRVSVQANRLRRVVGPLVLSSNLCSPIYRNQIDTSRNQIEFRRTSGDPLFVFQSTLSQSHNVIFYLLLFLFATALVSTLVLRYAERQISL